MDEQFPEAEISYWREVKGMCVGNDYHGYKVMLSFGPFADVDECAAMYRRICNLLVLDATEEDVKH